MSPIIGIALFVLTIAFMEGFAYVMHRWVMHGRLGWLLHASHHRPRSGPVRAQRPLRCHLCRSVDRADLWRGAGRLGRLGDLGRGGHRGLWRDLFRLPRRHRPPPRRPPDRAAVNYFKRIVQAHRIHHAVETREGTVSFGFIYAPPVERLKAALSASDYAGVRTPKGGSTATWRLIFRAGHRPRRTPRSPTRISPLSKC